MDHGKFFKLNKHCWLQLVIWTTAVVVFVIAAEILLRITCSYCTWTEKSGEGFVSPYGREEPSWYHVRDPDTVTTLHLPEFDYEIRTNSLGFRDIEHPLEKPENEFRILAIGDSFTEGWGARFEFTWLNDLRRALDEKFTGVTFRTMCAGSSGSDPFFGYRNLEDRLLPYRPDLVLLVVNDTDILDVVVRGGHERFLADGTVKGVESPDMPFLYESSQFARFILFEFFDYTHSLLRRPERNRRARQARDTLQDLLVEYQSLLAREGIAFTLVVQPYTKELVRLEYQRLEPLIDFAKQHRIEVIDTKYYLAEKLAEHDNRLEDLYWPIDMHFTELGYRYFAEAIERDIKLEPPGDPG